MGLVTDPSEVERLAREKETENWNFRYFVKACDVNDAELDRIVQRLLEQVTAEIACTKCGNCCRALQPKVADCDIQRLSKHLGMTRGKFRDQYTEVDEDAPAAFPGAAQWL